jgi:hypothetical protein
MVSLIPSFITYRYWWCDEPLATSTSQDLAIGFDLVFKWQENRNQLLISQMAIVQKQITLCDDMMWQINEGKQCIKYTLSHLTSCHFKGIKGIRSYWDLELSIYVI